MDPNIINTPISHVDIATDDTDIINICFHHNNDGSILILRTTHDLRPALTQAIEALDNHYNKDWEISQPTPITMDDDGNPIRAWCIRANRKDFTSPFILGIGLSRHLAHQDLQNKIRNFKLQEQP